MYTWWSVAWFPGTKEQEHLTILHTLLLRHVLTSFDVGGTFSAFIPVRERLVTSEDGYAFVNGVVQLVVWTWVR